MTQRTGSPVSANETPSRRMEWLGALFIVAATLAAYVQVRKAGFIWDDEMHVTQNPCIVGPLGLADIWTSRAARYFPLTLTTFWAEHALWGLNAFAFHAVNILVHAGCAVALWRVLRSLGVRGALLGATLWALHPVQVESVAWITELKNTQSCLFFLLSLLCYARWLSGAKGMLSYAGCLLFAALALASKSSTVVLPVVLALCAWWRKRTFSWRDLVPLAPIAAMAAAAAALSLWTQHLEGANAPEWTRGMAERFATSGRVFWFYLGKLAWPHPLIFIYPRWDIDASSAFSYAATAAMIAFLIVLWRLRASMGAAFFAFAYFFAALIPVLGFLDQYFWRYSFVGDHFQYLASMGPLALAGAGMATVFDWMKPSLRWAGYALAGILLSILGFLSWRQCADYESVETLWRSTIARNPGCWMARNNLGATYLDEGRPEDAVAQFKAALAARPDDIDAHQNLGNAYVRMGRLQDAAAEYSRTLELKADYAKGHNGLGDTLMRLGLVDRAVMQFKAALAIDPAFGEAEDNYGDAELRMGHPTEAIAHFRAAIAINPADIQAHANLGTALLAQGRASEAVSELQRALSLDPNFAAALVELGNVSFQERRFPEAAAYYSRAIAASPGLAEAHNNLGASLIEEGRLDEAIAQCRQALQLRPAYPEAHKNLGRALFKQGKVDEADAEFQRALGP